MKKKLLVIILCLLKINLIAQSQLDTILSIDEINWLNKNINNIKFAPNPSWPPGDFVENKEHKGIVSDYIKIYQNRLNTKFQNVYYTNWTEILTGLKKNEVDFVGAIHKTKEREQFYNFTDVYLNVPIAILVKKDYSKNFSDEEINQMHLSCVSDYLTLDYVKQQYPNAQITECADDLSAVLKTSFGETDGTIIDIMTASYLVDKYGITNLALGFELDFVWEIRFATRKELPELCSILNKLLKTIDNNERQQIYNKWVTINPFTHHDKYKKFTKVFAISIIILTSLFIISLLLVYLLKKQIKKQTSELEKAKIIAEKSEEKYRLIVENQTDLVVKMNSDGSFLYLSPSYCKVFGKTETELLNSTFLTLVHTEDIEFTIEKIKLLNKPPYSVYIEQRAMTKDGWRWFAWINSAILNENQQIKEIIGLGRDITEKKQNENDLILAKNKIQESELKFRNLFENSPIGKSLTSIDGTIFTNQTFCEILGYTEYELNQLTWQKITHPDDIQKSNEIIQSMLNGIAHNARFEKRYLHKTGKTVWTDVSIYLQRDTNQKPIFLITAIIDITERKIVEMELISAKEKAEESDRLKTAFLQNISHEIRTPMNAICGFSDFLSDNNLTNEKRDFFVKIIQNSSKQLLGIVTDIITISSLETKQEKLHFTNFNINNLISELYAIYKLKCDSKSISLRAYKTLSDEMSEIQMDKSKITQILTNLLENATKFTLKGFVEFGYKLIDNQIMFFVKDSGIGIKPDKQEKIFERFIQADEAIQTNFGGTGLGLSISKGFVELLDGKIWVDSEVDKGSSFYFTIPYKPSKMIDNSTLQQKISFKNNAIVLVAEDEVTNYLFLEEMLNRLNIKTIHAKNGQETIELFNANPDISMILMDIKMPMMTGDQAAKIIKKNKPNIPIIAQSAYAMEHERARYLGIFDDYLTKPINEDELKQKMLIYFNL